MRENAEDAEAEAAGRRLAAKREKQAAQTSHDFWHAIADNVTGDDRIVALNEARVALGGDSTAEAEAAGRRLAAKREELRGQLLHDFWRERADQATGDERTVALYEARKALKGKPPAAG